MGFKGYRLWVMGQLDSNVQSPTGWLSRSMKPSLGGTTPFFACSLLSWGGGGGISGRVT
jgi:hypothetical protein